VDKINSHCTLKGVAYAIANSLYRVQNGTNSAGQSPILENDSHSASQKILRHSWNQSLLLRSQGFAIELAWSLVNLIHDLKAYFYNIHHNRPIILRLRLGLLTYLFP
jgi:hypothetical protein